MRSHQRMRCLLGAALVAWLFGGGWPNLLASTAEMVRRPVIIDSDMAQLSDDAIVLFMLAKSDGVDVLGITLVAGNTWVEEGAAFCLRQLEIIGRTDIPVLLGSDEPLMGNRQAQLRADESLFGPIDYMGAFSRPKPDSYLNIGESPYGGYPSTRPSPENAVDFIVRQVKEHPHEVTLFAIGPATNIALAVKKNPEIVPLVKRIIYMGGAFDVPGNTTPAAEFNWWFDPEAAKICLRTAFKEQMVVSNDVAERVFFTKNQYDRIVGAPETPVTRMFRDLLGPGFAADPGRRSFTWDSITAAIFLRPSIATRMEERLIDIDTNRGPNYGRSIGYPANRGLSSEGGEESPVGTRKIQIVFDINREAFWDLYVELVTKGQN